MYEKAIYDIINENLINGELPEDFSLTVELGEEDYGYADGAYDGITLYHIGRSDVTPESIELIDRMVHEITDDDFDAAFFTLFRFSENNTALGSIDEFEGYILDNTEWINPTNLYNFATECLVSADRELIKYGLEIMEIFSEPSEGVKNFMRTLGLCDEFTLFVLFNIITNWSNANEEIFQLAKKTHGWGKIHAVERLQPETDEIKIWLLREGIKNTVMGEYSANPVFRRAEVAKLLKKELAEIDYEAITKIISCMLDEGPTSGMYVVSNSDEVLYDFLLQVKNHKLTYDIVNTVFKILDEERSDEVRDLCNEILETETSKRLIRKALRDGKGFSIAKYLDIYSAELIYNQMIEDFDKNFHNCGLLVKNDAYREKTLDLFRKKLPLDKMENIRKQNYGLGKEYRDFTALVMLIRELSNYPMCGADFVKLGLTSPIANNKTVALSVLDSWCKIKKCTLAELSPELAETVAALKEKEAFDSSKELFENLGF